MPQHRTALCFAAILIHCLPTITGSLPYFPLGSLTIYLTAPLSSCPVSFCPLFHCLSVSVPLSHWINFSLHTVSVVPIVSLSIHHCLTAQLSDFLPSPLSYFLSSPLSQSQLPLCLTASTAQCCSDLLSHCPPGSVPHCLTAHCLTLTCHLPPHCPTVLQLLLSHCLAV